MTDTNPLAPIEALLAHLRMDESRYPMIRGIDRDFRAALAEARQAVDALVVERDAALNLRTHSMCGKSFFAEHDQRVFAENAAIKAQAERDAAREALARVEALAKTQATSLQAAHRADMARNWLDVLAIIERAALAQPATDEEAGQ